MRAGLVIFLCLALAGCRSNRAPAASAFGPPAPPQPSAPTPDPARPPALEWSQIGLSVQGRPLRATTAGRGPMRIYLIGGIHGDEPEGRCAVPRLAELASTTPTKGLATLRIVEDANPDGSAAHRRTNARGRDLNRNWPAANFKPSSGRGPKPLSEPETQALSRDLDAFRPDLVIVFHSIATGPFVNLDGPAQSLAEAFASGARSVNPAWKVVAEMGYPTPGSLGSYIGIDRALPILTIEFKRGQDDKSARAAAEAGLAAVIRSAGALRHDQPTRQALPSHPVR